MMNYAKIATLLATPHPVSGAWAENNAEAADQFNVDDIERNVKSVSGQDLLEAVVPTEYNGLSDGEKQLLLAIIGMGTIIVNATNTRTVLLNMFGSGTVTRDNLQKLQTETVSLATQERLGTIYEGHIQQAKAI